MAPSTYSTSQGTSLVANLWGGVLAGAADADGDPITAVLVSGPTHGTLTLDASGAFEYVPDAGFSGLDSFLYQASDGLLLSTPAIRHFLDPGPGLSSTRNTSF